jgi:hypothetical protein
MKLSCLFLSLALALLLLAGCKEEEPAPIIEVLDLQNDSLKLAGMFQKEIHATTGTVKLYQRTDDKLLVLENFKTDNGPALYVYLSRDKSVSNSINLGVLKSASGTFSYEIDSNIDAKEYPYVLIWCREFAVLFGSAQLETP